MIKVVNVRQYVGEDVVYVGRRNKYAGLAQSPLHNPPEFLKQVKHKGETIPLFNTHLRKAIQRGDKPICTELLRLADMHKAGKDIILGCWCKVIPDDQTPCHADTIKIAIEWIAGNDNIYSKLKAAIQS